MSDQKTENRIGYLLKQVQYCLRRNMDKRLSAHGLTTPQYAAMLMLEESPGISGAGLSRRCFVTPQTMNLIISKLEQNGYINQVVDAKNKRALLSFLTDKGSKALRQACEEVDSVEKQLLKGMVQSDRKVFAGFLRTGIMNLG